MLVILPTMVGVFGCLLERDFGVWFPSRNYASCWGKEVADDNTLGPELNPLCISTDLGGQNM